jgi:hypothetical protein
MCKEMLVIPVDRAVDPKRIIGKMEGQGGGGEAQGVADPKSLIYTIRQMLYLRLDKT